MTDTPKQTELLSILLVEDNDDHAELTKRMLSEFEPRHNLYHVQDGEAAVDYLEGNGKFADRTAYPVPNLVLLDLKLPKITGQEVLAKIKNDAALKKIPVIILTSSDNPKDIEAAYGNHVNSYLVKPLDYGSFSKLVNQFGIYWLSLNNMP